MARVVAEWKNARRRRTTAGATYTRTKSADDHQRQSQARPEQYNAAVGNSPSISMTAGAGLALLTMGVLADCASEAGGNLMIGGNV